MGEVVPFIRQINEIAGKALADMCAQAASLVVDSDKKKGQANEMIAQTKKLSKAIEDRRVKIYDELYPKENRKDMKETNDRAKLYKDRLSVLCNEIEGKYLIYQEEQRQIAVKAEAERIGAEEKRIREEKERMEASKKEMEAKMAHVPPEMREEVTIEPMPAPEPAPAPVRPKANMVQGHTGSSYTKKEKYFEVEDLSRVPDEFKVLNEVLVRKAMHAGRPIPGIVYKERDKLATRLK